MSSIPAGVTGVCWVSRECQRAGLSHGIAGPIQGGSPSRLGSSTVPSQNVFGQALLEASLSAACLGLA
jgi:hypothetical protein